MHPIPAEIGTALKKSRVCVCVSAFASGSSHKGVSARLRRANDHDGR